MRVKGYIASALTKIFVKFRLKPNCLFFFIRQLKQEASEKFQLLIRTNIKFQISLYNHLSKPFSFNHFDIKSAISILFKSEKGKCVLPLIPISGR